MNTPPIIQHGAALINLGTATVRCDCAKCLQSRLHRLPMPARDNETFIWVTLAAACASALSLLFL